MRTISVFWQRMGRSSNRNMLSKNHPFSLFKWIEKDSKMLHILHLSSVNLGPRTAGITIISSSSFFLNLQESEIRMFRFLASSYGRGRPLSSFGQYIAVLTNVFHYGHGLLGKASQTYIWSGDPGWVFLPKRKINPHRMFSMFSLWHFYLLPRDTDVSRGGNLGRVHVISHVTFYVTW